jgi:hypothetical protein
MGQFLVRNRSLDQVEPAVGSDLEIKRVVRTTDDRVLDVERAKGSWTGIEASVEEAVSRALEVS